MLMYSERGLVVAGAGFDVFAGCLGPALVGNRQTIAFGTSAHHG